MINTNVLAYLSDGKNASTNHSSNKPTLTVRSGSASIIVRLLIIAIGGVLTLNNSINLISSFKN